jgi:predicted aspartyl protease
MLLTLRDELPFVTVSVTHNGQSIDVPDVLVDTGSASTLLTADLAAHIGIVPEPSDRLRTLRGVGGRELVFARRVQRFAVGHRGLDDFEIEIGGMDYGFAINGILGMDFLRQTAAVLNLNALTLEYA